MHSLSSPFAVVVLAALLAPAGFAQTEAPLANALRPEEGVLFGGQPSEQELAALGAAGYTVLDLRMPEEDRGFDEPAVAERLGIEYHNLPVGGPTLGDPQTFERFFELFEGAERPVVVHCASGNRVGGLYYAWLVAKKGVARDEALRQAQENGLRSDGLRQAIDGYLDSVAPR